MLAKHWPGVPIYDDVRTLTAARLAADGIAAPLADAGRLGCDSRAAAAEREARPSGIDLICGGFPCQDISTSPAQGAGIDGERSGLWSEYARLIGEVRPRYVVVENVAALLARGLGRVLGDLAALGYDAEWDCIPASAVGAPHRRDRVWIVAYPEHNGYRKRWTLLANWAAERMRHLRLGNRKQLSTLRSGGDVSNWHSAGNTGKHDCAESRSACCRRPSRRTPNDNASPSQISRRTRCR